MKRIAFSIIGFAIVAACTPAEDLQGPALQARVAGTELRFESETDETIVISLRPDGSGTVRDILPSDRPDRVDEVDWIIEGDRICLTSKIRASGRKECATAEIAGDRITIDGGSDPLIGTITPL